MKILIKTNFKYLKLAFILSIFFTSLSLNLITQRYLVPITDVNQYDLFSDLLIKNQTLTYNNELNEKYGIPIFGIRGLYNFGKTYFVPSVVPGMIIILALFKSVNVPIFLINPIFVLVCLWFFYRIVDNFLFDKKLWSLFTTAFYFSSGAFLYVSSLPQKDLVATATFIVGLYYLLNGIYNGKTANFALFGLFAGATMWMNYLNLIFYLPPILYYILVTKKELLKKHNLKNLASASIVFLLLFIPLYIYQVRLFGGFLNFNNPVFRLNYYESYNVQKNPIISFILDINIIQLLINCYNHFFLVNPVLISFSVLGSSFIILDVIKNKKINKVLIILLAIIIMQFLFYLSKLWSGVFFQGSVGTSYSRYLLISWGLLIILSITAIKRVVKKQLFLMFLCIFLIFSGVYSGLYDKMAVKYFIYTSKWANNLRNEIIENTPENSIIFTSFYDKYIYPVRQTAIYVAISEEERVNKTVYLMKELLEDDYSVYIVDERDSYSISPVLNKDIFEKNGLFTERVFRDFYKITFSNNP